MLADILHCYGLVDIGRDHNMIFFFFSYLHLHWCFCKTSSLVFLINIIQFQDFT